MCPSSQGQPWLKDSGMMLGGAGRQVPEERGEGGAVRSLRLLVEGSMYGKKHYYFHFATSPGTSAQPSFTPSMVNSYANVQTPRIVASHNDPAIVSASPASQNSGTSLRTSQSEVDSKRRAVPVACLRCRRRKIRCSGLPGPCVSCEKFGVACIDPGKRKSKSKNTVEASHQATTITTATEQGDVEHMAINEHNMLFHTPAMYNWDDALLRGPANVWDSSAFPDCISEPVPEVHMDWPQSESDVDTKPFGGIARASTLPHIGLMPNVMDACNPLPTLSVATHSVSPVASPQPHASFQTSFQNPEEGLSAGRPSSNVSMDCFSGFLALTEHMMHNPQHSKIGPRDIQGTAGSTTAGTGRRRNTTSLESLPQHTADRELNWILDSPRTTSYLEQYRDVVHGHYPFLNLVDHFAANSPGFQVLGEQQQNFAIYQRLLQAAIGAMLSHKARDIAAQYLRHAMSMQDREGMEFFNSVDGIHCAMLLVLYLYLESQIVFEDDLFEDDVGHPYVNLWQWNCRIAAACIDLGLFSWDEHVDAAEMVGDREGRARQRICRDTFCSAWKLDGEVSQSTGRPRALHVENVDPRMMAWMLRQEGLSNKL